MENEIKTEPIELIEFDNDSLMPSIKVEPSDYQEDPDIEYADPLSMPSNETQQEETNPSLPKKKKVIKRRVTFQCPLCDTARPCEISLKNHMFTFHKFTTKHKCPHCNFKYYTKSDLEKHCLEKHVKNKDLFICPHCKEFKTTESVEFVQHIRKVHVNKKEHICRVCGEQFRNRKLMNSHMEDHKNFSCDYCGAKFMAERILNIHLTRVHDRVDKVQEHDYRACDCSSCKVKLAQSDGFQGRKPYGTAKFTCHKCPKQFSVQQKLTKHIFEDHEFKFEKCCFMCNFVTDADFKLDNHMKRQHFKLDKNGFIHVVDTVNPSEYPQLDTFQCFKCNLSTENREEMKLHMVEHFKTASDFKPKIKTKIEPSIDFEEVDILVPETGLEVEENKQVEVHEKFKCKICLQEYPNLQAIKTHIDIFHNDLFELDESNVCPRKTCKFVGNLKNLAEHMFNIHAEISCYPCQFCKGKFPKIQGLKYHMSKMHKDNICPYCKSSFDQEKALKSHLKVEHPDLYSTTEGPSTPCQNINSQLINIEMRRMSKAPKPVKSLKCRKCLKECSHAEALREHTQRCSNIRYPNICPKEGCEFVGVTQDQLADHLLRVHDEKACFQCKLCSCKFPKERQLKGHMTWTHRKNICPHCKASFGKEKFLKVHIQTEHSDLDGQSKSEQSSSSQVVIKAEPPDLVDIDIVVKSELKDEIDSVDYEPNFEEDATESDEEQVSLAQLKKRKANSELANPDVKKAKTVSGYRVHKCPQCDLKFCTYNEVDNHLAEKHGESGCHKCPYCPCMFGREAMLNSHVREVHMKFKCSINLCDERFATKQELTHHIQEIHKLKVIN